MGGADSRLQPLGRVVTGWKVREDFDRPCERRGSAPRSRFSRKWEKVGAACWLRSRWKNVSVEHKEPVNKQRRDSPFLGREVTVGGGGGVPKLLSQPL